MTTVANILKGIRTLEADIEYLEEKLDRLDPDSLEAESADRILTVKYRLISEEQTRLHRAEIMAAREAAEARLAYHDEHDTLDLY